MKRTSKRYLFSLRSNSTPYFITHISKQEPIQYPESLRLFISPLISSVCLCQSVCMLVWLSFSNTQSKWRQYILCKLQILSKPRVTSFFKQKSSELQSSSLLFSFQVQVNLQNKLQDKRYANRPHLIIGGVKWANYLNKHYTPAISFEQTILFDELWYN